MFPRMTVVYLKNSLFWDVAPCKSCVNRRFGGTYHLHLQGGKIRERNPAWAAADFSALKMEAIRSSEMSVHIRSTQRHIPEDGILHSHRCENLKSYISLWIWVVDITSLKNLSACDMSDRVFLISKEIDCYDVSTCVLVCAFSYFHFEVLAESSPNLVWSLRHPTAR
jgi:hypothetical protein